MAKLFALACVVGALGTAVLWTADLSVAQEPKVSPTVVHNVYFSLKDKSPASSKKLVDACNKYLKPQPGVTFFAAGVLAAELNRPVNDLDWDVGLHVVFKDMASHDKYQDDPEHKKFIEENKENWAKVRVFDTLGQ